MINNPLVSVVIPSLNQADFLALAVESLLSQNYPSMELIVVDGGSTDTSLAWLAQRQLRDSRLRWISEPDTGAADALNKALRLTRGTAMANT